MTGTAKAGVRCLMGTSQDELVSAALKKQTKKDLEISMTQHSKGLFLAHKMSHMGWATLQGAFFCAVREVLRLLLFCVCTILSMICTQLPREKKGSPLTDEYLRLGVTQLCCSRLGHMAHPLCEGGWSSRSMHGCSGDTHCLCHTGLSEGLGEKGEAAPPSAVSDSLFAAPRELTAGLRHPQAEARKIHCPRGEENHRSGVVEEPIR